MGWMGTWHRTCPQKGAYREPVRRVSWTWYMLNLLSSCWIRLPSRFCRTSPVIYSTHVHLSLLRFSSVTCKVYVFNRTVSRRQCPVFLFLLSKYKKRILCFVLSLLRRLHSFLVYFSSPCSFRRWDRVVSLRDVPRPQFSFLGCMYLNPGWITKVLLNKWINQNYRIIPSVCFFFRLWKNPIGVLKNPITSWKPFRFHKYIMSDSMILFLWDFYVTKLTLFRHKKEKCITRFLFVS